MSDLGRGWFKSRASCKVFSVSTDRERISNQEGSSHKSWKGSSTACVFSPPPFNTKPITISSYRSTIGKSLTFHSAMYIEAKLFLTSPEISRKLKWSPLCLLLIIIVNNEGIFRQDRHFGEIGATKTHNFTWCLKVKVWSKWDFEPKHSKPGLRFVIDTFSSHYWQCSSFCPEDVRSPMDYDIFFFVHLHYADDLWLLSHWYRLRLWLCIWRRRQLDADWWKMPTIVFHFISLFLSIIHNWINHWGPTAQNLMFLDALIWVKFTFAVLSMKTQIKLRLHHAIALSIL